MRSNAALTCFLTLVATLALVARVAVPAGWMPAQDEAGAVRITICTGYGLQQAWIDAEGTLHTGSPDADGEHSGDGQPHCPFTASAMPLALGDMPELPAVPYPAESARTEALPDLAPGRGLAAPPPPQTGPPVHS